MTFSKIRLFWATEGQRFNSASVTDIEKKYNRMTYGSLSWTSIGYFYYSYWPNRTTFYISARGEDINLTSIQIGIYVLTCPDFSQIFQAYYKNFWPKVTENKTKIILIRLRSPSWAKSLDFWPKFLSLKIEYFYWFWEVLQIFSQIIKVYEKHRECNSFWWHFFKISTN